METRNPSRLVQIGDKLYARVSASVIARIDDAASLGFTPDGKLAVELQDGSNRKYPMTRDDFMALMQELSRPLIEVQTTGRVVGVGSDGQLYKSEGGKLLPWTKGMDEATAWGWHCKLAGTIYTYSGDWRQANSAAAAFLNTHFGADTWKQFAGDETAADKPPFPGRPFPKTSRHEYNAAPVRVAESDQAEAESAKLVDFKISPREFLQQLRAALFCPQSTPTEWLPRLVAEQRKTNDAYRTTLEEICNVLGASDCGLHFGELAAKVSNLRSRLETALEDEGILSSEIGRKNELLGAIRKLVERFDEHPDVPLLDLVKSAVRHYETERGNANRMASEIMGIRATAESNARDMKRLQEQERTMAPILQSLASMYHVNTGKNVALVQLPSEFRSYIGRLKSQSRDEINKKQRRIEETASELRQLDVHRQRMHEIRAALQLDKNSAMLDVVSEVNRLVAFQRTVQHCSDELLKLHGRKADA